jgi:hypothetical protein
MHLQADQKQGKGNPFGSVAKGQFSIYDTCGIVSMCPLMFPFVISNETIFNNVDDDLGRKPYLHLVDCCFNIK